MGMKKITSTVGIRIKGNLVEDIGIKTNETKNKSLNFKVDENLYRKFEFIVGRGNVSEVIRKFMLAVVRKYERIGIHFKEVQNERQKQEKG
jgi:hypothetical protein